MKELTASFIKTLYKRRVGASNKGTYGHALVIAGNTGKMGAAVICAHACVRAGAGLTTVYVPANERFILQTALPEAMLQMRSSAPLFTGISACGIGPGLHTSATSLGFLKKVLQQKEVALVIDADALNLLAANKTLHKKIPAGSILTPHPKEFFRLFAVPADDRNLQIETAKKQAMLLQCIIILKGEKTFITDGIHHFENTTGNAGLAKGGSGDALTGMLTALLAQGYTPLHAACMGVYLHGLAADITLASQSEESMMITDVIENFGAAFKRLS